MISMFGLCSSVIPDGNANIKAISYHGELESGHEISSLCGKLIPILERLELLSEVFFYLSHSFTTSNILVTTSGRDDHEFISKEYFSIGTKPFGEAQSKAMRAYAQSGQYHTIVESRDS